MKKLAIILLSLMMLFSVIACNNNNDKNSGSTPNSGTQSATDGQTGSNDQGTKPSAEDPYVPMPPAPTVDFTDKSKTVIYLAGDSTVKTYAENTFIGGWGQFLHLFLKDGDTFVENKANGGRSSRSFINEGRLTTLADKDYVKAKYTSIESTIKEGDYLLIQFGHNDEETNGDKFENYLDRKVPLGTPDEMGVYPTVEPKKVSTETLPADYVQQIKENNEKEFANIKDEAEKQAKITAGIEADTKSALNVLKPYGKEYYSFDCGGTYKGYLKMYVDFARSKGAIPVICTPVARVKFNSDGTLMGGNGRHGVDFAYVKAAIQLAREEECFLIDTFDFTKKLLETTTKDYANYLMALKPNGIQGKWPVDYDTQWDATGADKQWTGIEATHYNKFGAYVTAAYIAETLYGYAENEAFTEYQETVTFGKDISLTPSFTIACPTHLQPKYDAIKALLTRAKLEK